MTPRPHDAFFKETFSNLDNARGELRSVLPPAVSALIDWSSLQLEPGSFVDEALRETLTDLLFSVQMHGREAQLYLLFEHQSSPDPLMPFRVLAYIVRVWDAWLRDNRGATRLPPVIPVLLAQVDGGWASASDLLSIIDFADDAERAVLGPYVPQCRLLVDDLAHLTNDDLDGRPLPDEARLALAALRDVRSSTDIKATILRWRRWLHAKTNTGTLVSYLMHASTATPEQLAKIFGSIEPTQEERVMSTATDLIQQGKREGMAAGKAEMLCNLLRLRFGAPATTIRDRVHAADAATLDRWAARVLTATSIDEVLAD